MRALSRHPVSPCDAVSAIAATAERTAPGRLRLRYEATGAVAGVAIPPPAAPVRTDGLWKHTCFEAFLRTPGAEGYIELNLSPSGQWAAYRFERPREGMAALDIPAPAIVFRADPDRLVLEAAIDLAAAPGLPPAGPWRLALTAVIEEAFGRTSYWALAHPPGRPDFHSPDGFTLDLPAP